MSLSKATVEAIETLPKEARFELANEIIGGRNVLVATTKHSVAFAALKADELGRLIRILRGEP